MRNSRRLILGTFYIFAFFLSIYFSGSMAYNYRNTRICIHISTNTVGYLFQIIFIFLFVFPLLYYFLLATTCLSKYFGGQADPILDRLTDPEIDRVHLIKRVTFLKCLIEFFIEIHSSSYLYCPHFSSSCSDSSASWPSWQPLLSSISMRIFSTQSRKESLATATTTTRARQTCSTDGQISFLEEIKIRTSPPSTTRIWSKMKMIERKYFILYLFYKL